MPKPPTPEILYGRTFSQAAHIPERFWEKVLLDAHGCWEWVAGKRLGYGAFWINDQSIYAHRFAYETEIGPIPEGLCIDHLCRNRGCVRPDHMEIVTRAENTRRANTKEL